MAVASEAVVVNGIEMKVIYSTEVFSLDVRGAKDLETYMWHIIRIPARNVMWRTGFARVSYSRVMTTEDG